MSPVGRKYWSYDVEQLLGAATAVLEGTNLALAAKKHKVPRTTLRRFVESRKKRKLSEVDDPVEETNVNDENEYLDSIDSTSPDEDILEKDIEEETIVESVNRTNIEVWWTGKDKEQHQWVYLSKVVPQEEENEVDIGDDCDADDEIQIIEAQYETIEIPDDGDEVIVFEQFDNGDSSPKSSPGSKAVPENSEKDKVVNGMKNGLCSLSGRAGSTSTPLSIPETVIKNSQSRSNVMDSASPQFPKSVFIGGALKKVLTVQDLKSGALPLKSILSKDVSMSKPMVNGTPPERKVSLLKPRVSSNPSQSLLKLHNQQSVLKPIGLNNVRPTNLLKNPLNQFIKRSKRSLLKPELIKGQNEQQSLVIKPVLKTADPLKSNAGASTSKTPEAIKTGTGCLYCSKVFTDDADLQIHIVTEHPHANLNEATNLYSASAINELERELKDQSLQCKQCKAGLLYHLPNLNAHAKVHPSGQSGCEGCRDSTFIIKRLINHLEEHAESIGEYSD